MSDINKVSESEVMDASAVESAVENSEEKGASMLEYALLAALIAVVCIVAIMLLGQSACKAFSYVASGMAGAVG